MALVNVEAKEHILFIGLELDDWAGVFANGEGLSLNEGEMDPFGIVGPAMDKPVVYATQGTLRSLRIARTEGHDAVFRGR